MLPFDLASALTIAAAAGLLAVAAFGRLSTSIRVVLIVVAALAIRVDPARQQSIHQWDESFHALVAKNTIAHPLTPTLYERPVVEPPAWNWVESRVWLHKPPLALWLMAMSMSILGTNAMAMRLPSVLLSTLSVLLTFLIGRRLVNARVGLLAAGFQSVNGLLVNLESGRRVADHVDTLLIVCIQAGLYLVLLSSGARRFRTFAFAAGLATGAGLLAKSFPALLVPAVAMIHWSVGQGTRRTLTGLTLLSSGAVLVAAPWFVYTALAFPVEARTQTAYALSHMTTAIEGQTGSPLTYVKDLGRFYGELVYLPIGWLALKTMRGSTAPNWLLLAWMATPYIVFSAMATKMPAFIAIAAPSLFVIQAAFWCEQRDRLARYAIVSRWLMGSLLVLLALLPARNLLEPTGPFERRDRSVAITARTIGLESDVRPDAVIFNVPRARELMFYSQRTAYERLPTPAEVTELQSRGRPFFVYVPPDSAVSDFKLWDGHLLLGKAR